MWVQEAVELGLIDEIGGLSDALGCLYGMMEEGKGGKKPFSTGRRARLGGEGFQPGSWVTAVMARISRPNTSWPRPRLMAPSSQPLA